MELNEVLEFLTSWYLLIVDTGNITHPSQGPTVYTTASAANPSITSFAIEPVIPSISAIPKIDPSFPGLACEERSFAYYAGSKKHENKFSKNLVSEIARRTNTRPVIRVGGTSLDQSYFDATQTNALVAPPQEMQENVPRNLSIGPSYFESFATFGEALYILGVPLASDNLDNAVEFAKTGYSMIGRNNVLALEVGSEPNAYGIQGKRRRSWDSEAYIEQWTQYTSAISKALGLPISSPIYQALGLSLKPHLLPALRGGKDWRVEEIFDQGLDKIRDRISSVSLHYYQTVATPESDLQRDLMNHTAVKVRLDYFVPIVDFLKKKGLSLNLAEVGSALNPRRNNYKLESVFGATLWQLDFMLYAMSAGINRVNFQLGIGFGFALWQPVDYNGRPAEVAPPYYAQIAAADFIGDQGPIRVANINTSSDLLSAYSAYDDATGRVIKLAIVNLQFWSDEYRVPFRPRPYVTVTVNVPNAAQKISVSYLSSPFGATAANSSHITWKGRSWTRASQGLGVPSTTIMNDTMHLKAQDGVVTVRVDASSAAIMQFE